MNRLKELFSSGRKALAVFLTAGFPEPGLDEELALAVLDAGADILEIGFPFSDPLADGPMIQRASELSLKNGTTLAKSISLAGRLRQKTEAPLVLMGYANPVYHMGYPEFADRVAGAGADGVIVADLPMDESGPLRDELKGKGVSLIPMAAPNTSVGRLNEIIKTGSGFLYIVSMTGLTGDAFEAEAPWRKLARIARDEGSLPVCVGFGISNGDDAVRAAREADGVIVGTAVISAIFRGLEDSREAAVENAVVLVRELALALEMEYPFKG